MRFGNGQALQLLIIIIPLLAYFVYKLFIIINNVNKFFDTATAQKVFYPVSKKLVAIKYALLFISIILLVVAMARPLGKPIKSEQEYRGIDIMLVIDVSSSMAADDMAPDRMEAVKAGLKNFTSTLGGDRVGMTTFAGVDFIQCPLTTDYDALDLIIDSLYPGMLFKDGTALGNAIKASVDRLVEKAEKSRIMILITDGESTAGISPVEAAKIAEEKGIRIYTIGVGTLEGGKIPEGRDAFGRQYFKTYKGEMVVTKLDDSELKKIAGLTGGKYYRVTDKNAFAQINSDIRTMEENKLKDEKHMKYEENYQKVLNNARMALFGKIPGSAIITSADPNIPPEKFLDTKGQYIPAKFALAHMHNEKLDVTYDLVVGGPGEIEQIEQFCNFTYKGGTPISPSVSATPRRRQV